jgi:hypothetical protein
MPEILNTVNTLRMNFKTPVATCPLDDQNILGTMVWVGYGVTFKLDPERRRLSRHCGLDHQVCWEQGWAHHVCVRNFKDVHQSWTTPNIEHNAMMGSRQEVLFNISGCP